MRTRWSVLWNEFQRGQSTPNSGVVDAIPAGFAQAIQGFRLAPAGGYLISLPGTIRAHASALAANVVDVHAVQWADGSVHIFAPLSTGTNVQRATSPTLPLSFSQVAGATCATPTGWAQLNNVLYISDGGALNKCVAAGTWTNDIAGTPAALNGIVTYNNRLWGFYQNNLYYSALANGDTLGNAGSGGGTIVFPQPLTALAVIGSSLLLFTPIGVQRFTGYSADDFQVVNAPQAGLMVGVGLPVGAHRQSVAVLDNIAYVKASDGLVWAISESSSRVVSYTQPSFGTGTPVLSASPVTHHVSVGAFEYTPLFDAWVTTVGIRTTILRSTFVPTTSEVLAVFSAPTTQTFVRRIEVESDQGGKDDRNSDGTGGSGMDRIILSRPLSMGVEDVSLRFLSAYGTWASSGGNVPQVGVAEDGTVVAWTTLPAASDTGRVVVHVPTVVRHPRLQLAFQQTAVNDVLGSVIFISALGAEGVVYGGRKAVGAAS